jgi:ABC-type Co2+ transport system permease subunit
MHIEPGVVDGAKLALGYATGAASLAVAGKLAVDSIRHQGGAAAFLVRTVATTALVFAFFEILPHHPVGVSEVHLILGSTLYLLFGAGPAAAGLALGLLVQGVFFAPADLPQYGMNVTTLIVPLVAMAALARRIVPSGTPYVDLRYRDTLALSTAYQGGIVAWVAFWALYGQGFSAGTLQSVATFGAAYMTVIVLEPLVDLAVLAAAKGLRGLRRSGALQPRLFQAA